MRSGFAALSLCLGLAICCLPAAAEDPPLTVPAPVPATPPAAAAPSATPPSAAAPSSTTPPAATPPAAAAAPAGDQKAPAGDPVGVGGSGWAAEVAPNGNAGITLDDKQTEIVKKVSAYFNALGDLKGAFLQTAGDNKAMKGKFFLKRPGRFRFDYALPSKQIIISDGEYLAIQDLDLNNEDRVALDQTPFRLLLRKDVDLIRDAKISEVQEAEDMIVLAVIDKDPDTTGKIKLFFSTKPELELKEWVTTDAQGVNTRVEVSQLTKGETIDISMFKIEPVNFNKFHP